jgi:hypothetical protein
VTAVVGVGVALVVWNPVLVLVLGMVSMVPAMVGFTLHAQTKRDGPAGSSRAEIGRMLALAARVAVCIIAACAYTAASPPLALTLVVAGVVTSPRIRRWLAPRVVGAPDLTQSPVADVRPVDELSIDELCQQWCRTFQAVLSNDPPLAARVVGMRQVYLDEMERRDPAGLQSWLMSGPHAGSSPEEYLVAERDPGIT